MTARAYERSPILVDTPLDRVCIVMLSTVGGAVWTLPLVNALKRARPNSHVAWVIQSGADAFVRGHAAVDEVIAFERSRGLRGFMEIRRRLRHVRFDVVVAAQSYLKTGIVTSFVNAPVKLGASRGGGRGRDGSWLFTTHRLPAGAAQHAQDEVVAFARALGVDPEPLRWDVGPWDSERRWQQEFLATFERPAAAIVVGTTKPEKDWLPERWAQVADALWYDFGLEPVLVGGESAREMHAQRVIRERARRPPRSALGSGLRKLVAIIDGSVLTLAPDTGPLHVAVALERPVVSLMGYTNPKRSGPYRRYHDLMIDAYGDPGEDYSVSGRNRPGRMARIRVQDVLDRVELWRRRYAASTAPKE